MIVVIIIFISLIICSGLLFQFLGRYAVNYRISEKYVDVLLFWKIPLMHIKLRDVTEVRTISIKGTMSLKGIDGLLALRCGNRIFGKIVLIRRKNSIFKTILITPDNAEGFISKVKSWSEKDLEEPGDGSRID